MKASVLRTSILALGLAALPAILSAQDNNMTGVWDVSVTVKNCQTGALIRTVRSLQMFLRDGSFTETANTASRGISVGTWTHAEGQTYQASYSFFRYNADGTFAGVAKSADTINLSNNAAAFSASGTIQDYDANNVLISKACFTHAVNRQPDSSPPLPQSK